MDILEISVLFCHAIYSQIMTAEALGVFRTISIFVLWSYFTNSEIECWTPRDLKTVFHILFCREERLHQWNQLTLQEKKSKIINYWFFMFCFLHRRWRQVV